jgi:hypothetical protein
MAELRRVGLADNDRTRGFEPRHLNRVRAYQIVFEGNRAVGRCHPGDIFEVLDAKRDSRERPNFSAACNFVIHCARFVERLVEASRAKRVEQRIERFNSRDRRGHQLARLEFPPPDHLCEIGRGPPMQLIHSDQPRSYPDDQLFLLYQ